MHAEWSEKSINYKSFRKLNDYLWTTANPQKQTLSLYGTLQNNNYSLWVNLRAE